MLTASKSTAVLAGIATAALLLAGCHGQVTVGSMTVNNDVLASQVQAKLARDRGGPPPQVVCPGKLDATAGATTTCTMTDAKGSYDVVVTVTRMEFGDVILDDNSPGNVDDVGNAYFDIKVVDKPTKPAP